MVIATEFELFCSQSWLTTKTFLDNKLKDKEQEKVEFLTEVLMVYLYLLIIVIIVDTLLFYKINDKFLFYLALVCKLLCSKFFFLLGPISAIVSCFFEVYIYIQTQLLCHGFILIQNNKYSMDTT